MPPIVTLVGLTVLLSAACLALLWYYTDWPKLLKGITSGLLLLLLLAVIIPAVLWERPYELNLQTLPSEPAVVMAGIASRSPAETTPEAPEASEPPAPEGQEALHTDPDDGPEVPNELPSDPDQRSEESSPSGSAAIPPESGPPAESSAAEPEKTQAVSSPDPVGMLYILNTSTKKFHRSSCSDAARIKESNYATTDSRSYAVNHGYAPCKRCKP